MITTPVAITSRLKRPSRCSITSWAPQIRSPSARLPKFAPDKTELRYHTSSQLEQLLRELREERRSYFGHLTYHLAVAPVFTGCRYHEWAILTVDRLVREPGEVIIGARLQLKGGSFRDCPSQKVLIRAVYC